MRIAAHAELARRVGAVKRRRRVRVARPALAVEHELGVVLAAVVRRAVHRYATALGGLDLADPDGATRLLERARAAATIPRQATDDAVVRAAYAAARHQAGELGDQIEAALGIRVPLEALRPERVRAMQRETVGRLNGWLDELHRAAGKALRAALDGGEFRPDAADDEEPDPWDRCGCWRADLELPIEFAVENVQQISGLALAEKEQLAQALAGLHAAGDLSNRRRAEVVQFLIERLEMGERRAKFIARDQVARLVGQVNGDRQMALGITHYEWDTRRDRRVRPLHKRRRGKIFEWASPPSPDPFPGAAILCRCSARPLLNDVRVILGGRPRRPGSPERPVTYEPPRRTKDESQDPWGTWSIVAQ